MRTPDDAPDWSDLAGLLEAAVAAFGAPAFLWEEVVIERRDGLELRAWLRALEGLARALLLALALRMPMIFRAARRSGSDVIGKRDAITPRSPLVETGSSAEEIPPSERWAGVAFRALPSPARGGGGRAPSPHHRFVAARSLAFRLEALIRVCNSPERYARRLARRLAGGAVEPLARRIIGGEAPARAPRFARASLESARALARAALSARAADTS